MKEFWNTVQFVFTAVGGWLGYFLGGCDGLIYALLAFVVIDYLTGVMCAVSDRKLSSAVGFRGICRKVLIFLLVGIANILDVRLPDTWPPPQAFRSYGFHGKDLPAYRSADIPGMPF